MKKKVVLKLVIPLALLCLINLAFAQESGGDKLKPETKKTGKGVEVTLFDVSVIKELDPDNRVALFRMGSCPPGVALSGMKLQGNPGQEAIVILIGLKFPAGYEGRTFPCPCCSMRLKENTFQRICFNRPAEWLKNFRRRAIG